MATPRGNNFKARNVQPNPTSMMNGTLPNPARKSNENDSFKKLSDSNCCAIWILTEGYCEWDRDMTSMLEFL